MSEQKYFLGSATPEGFVTPIDDVLSDTSNTVYILKGTAGSGKSTLMKKISEAFSDSPRELYFCSADPYSLDAVYLKDKRVLIMDGTDPHCFDPKYPKAVQSIIDLGAYMEGSKLRENKNAIITLTDEYSRYHKRCRLYLTAIASVISDICTAAADALDREKLSGFISRTARRLIPKKASKTVRGKISRKQLSALTFNGYTTYVPDEYKIYLLSDEFITGSDIFLREMADTAVKKGYDITVSKCLISKEHCYEHLLIPELSLAFISSGIAGSVNIPESKKVINFRRFYSKEFLDEKPVLRKRIKFGKKAASELMTEASGTLKAAKEIHDRIEDYYISAADFDSLNRLTYKLISEIKSL